MKKHFLYLIIFLSFISFSFAEDLISSNDVSLNPTTGFPKIEKKPFVMFNEGLAISNVTRIQNQENRSNFVYNDTMAGAYFAIKTQNMMPVNSIIRVAAFYPFYCTFNKVPQASKQTVLYAFDLFAAPVLEANMWQYVRINFAPGLHFLYQLTDTYHLIDLGIGALLGAELPLARRWTILINGIASFDYANLGTNSAMSPIDICYQYQLDLGVRYSKKGENKFSYITSRVKK